MAFAALTIDLNAHLAKFETDMARAGKSLDSLNSRASAAAAGLKNAFGALGVGIGVGALAAFAKSGIDAADSLNDMSVRLGVSVKDLASFQLAADQSGTSLESVGEGVSRLSKSIGLAEAGNKQLAGALQGLGITARDPKEAFFQLADAVQRIEDPSKRAALLSQVLGKSYGELVPLLSQGSDALRQSARQSETFAEAMSRLAPNADKFNDQLAAMKINAAGLASELLVKLVPALNDVFERIDLVKNLIGAGGLFNTIAITAGTSEISTVMRRLKDDIKSTQDAIAGEKAKGKDASPFEEKLRSLNAQLLVMKENSRNAALALGEQFKNYKVPQTPGGAGDNNQAQLACIKDGGTWDGKRCIKAPKADPQGLFVSKLRDEAATLGMGAEALQRYEALKLKLTGTNARLADSFITQIAAFKDQQAAADANNKSFDEYLKKEDDANAARENSIKSLREWIAEQEFEASLFGKTNAEREVSMQLRAAEVVGIDTQTEAFKRMRDQIVAISETKQLDSLVGNADFSKLKKDQEDMILLAKAFSDGIVQADGSLRKLSESEYLDAVAKRLGLAADKVNELDTFAKTAAENIQNSFADFLFDPFDKGIKGMAQSFGDTIKHMIANAVAADLTKKLFGGLADNGKTSGDGWAGAALNMIGGLLKFDGGGYTGDGARAGGVDGKGGFLAVMHPRETVVDHTRGQSMGGHTVIVNVNGSNNAPDVRRAAGQGAREALGMISGAQRYA